MGLWQTTATVIYQDNQPAIRIAYNDGNCKTKKMLVDIGTKVTVGEQFKWMRDALSGYLIEIGNSIPEGANWSRK